MQHNITVTIRQAGDARARTIPTDEVTPDFLEQFAAELDELEEAIILLEVSGFDHWDEQERRTWFALLRLLEHSRHASRITIDRAEYNDPFSAAIDRLVDAENLGLHEQRLSQAITTVAALHAETAYDGAATRIVARLEALGVKADRRALLKLIRKAADPADDIAGSATPTLLAADFLEYLERNAPTAWAAAAEEPEIEEFEVEEYPIAAAARSHNQTARR
ncbi:MAG: hypothetical protein GX621_03440 [Pirellulaceae bacterium]|nr:hypothetical protein [Pirellulaceae bacterium]